jgi:hypothetical protein
MGALIFCGHDRGVGARPGFRSLCVCRRLHQYNPIRIKSKIFVYDHCLQELDSGINMRQCAKNEQHSP